MQVTGSGPAYYISDRLGSVRGLMQGNSLIASYEYDPYGNQWKTAGTGIDSDLGFAGYFRHAASGLDFTRNRVYNPGLARWLTRDPIGFRPAFAHRRRFNATNLNLYAYGRNNPMSLRDSSGLDPAWFSPGWFAQFIYLWASFTSSFYGPETTNYNANPETPPEIVYTTEMPPLPQGMSGPLPEEYVVDTEVMEGELEAIDAGWDAIELSLELQGIDDGWILLLACF